MIFKILLDAILLKDCEIYEPLNIIVISCDRNTNNCHIQSETPSKAKIKSPLFVDGPDNSSFIWNGLVFRIQECEMKGWW